MCFFDSCKRHLSVKANLHIQDDGLMILCSVCDLWQHAVCYGIMEEDDAPRVHVCVECSKVKKKPVNFPRLHIMNQHAQSKVFLCRFWLCSFISINLASEKRRLAHTICITN